MERDKGGDDGQEKAQGQKEVQAVYPVDHFDRVDRELNPVAEESVDDILARWEPVARGEPVARVVYDRMIGGAAHDIVTVAKAYKELRDRRPAIAASGNTG